MTICERIKCVRKELKMNQTDFGKSLSVSRDTINNYDNGRATPTQLFIDNLCRVHNVNVVWLETGEGEMFREESMSADLVDFVGRVSTLPDHAFKKRFACALARLTEDDWEMVERFIDSLLEEEQRKKDSE